MEANPQQHKGLAGRSFAALKSILIPKLRSRLHSDAGLTRKAYLNALAALLDYTARLLSGFLVNPLLVAGLGNYLYGVWQVLGRLIGYASAASGRPTEALKWTVANRQASADYDEKRRSVGSAVLVWLLFLPLLSSIGGVLAWYAPIWLAAPSNLVGVVRLAAAILVIDLIITSLVDVPESVLRGENLGYKRMGLTAILVFVQGGLIGLAVILQTGIVGVAAAVLFDTLLTAGLFLYIARSYVPWFGIARPLFAEVRSFFSLSGWFLVWRLVMQLMMGADVAILGLLNSAESVTTYSLTKYTPETLISLVAIVVGGVTPGLGGVIGSGNMRKAVGVRNEIMAGTWLIATIVGATTLLWNRSFVGLWVGEEHYAGSLATVLVMLMVVQFILIRSDANIIDLTLKLRRKVLIGALSVVLSIALASVLITIFHLGIVGLCVGIMTGRLILTVGYPWMAGRFLGVPLSAQFKSALRPLIVTMLLFLLMAAWSNTVLVRSWLGLVVAVGLTTVVVTITAFYIGLSTKQRQLLLRRVRSALQPTHE
jgi:O-antigen/teichoic acid export membrane protein